VNVLPSIKANFVLALRRILTQEGMGCDTFGPGELEAALRSGVRPELISVNGSVKDAALIERAVSAGARITLDSAREVDLVREADLGGGFASPRDPTGRALHRAAERPARAPSVEEYAEAITSTLREELVRHGLEPAGKTLEVEPGRSLYADAGIHLATVRNVKREAGRVPPRWVETDTTEMFLPDLLIEHNRWITMLAARADSAPAEPVDVVGMSCGFDMLGSDVLLPEMKPGDVVAFLDTGAYQDASSS